MVAVTNVETDRRVALNIRDIPESLRERFKSACAGEGKSMTAMIVDFMGDVAMIRPNPLQPKRL